MALAMTEEALRGGAAVTLAFLALFHVFFFCQAVNKGLMLLKYRKQHRKFFPYYNSEERSVLMWDVTVRNLMEQALVFLPMFWLALAQRRDGDYASVLYRGWAYVALRALYPLFWAAGGGGNFGVNYPIVFVTVPMYMINASFMMAVGSMVVGN